MRDSCKGMSANQLERTLGISYRIAWYLYHRIRKAMGNGLLTGPTLLGVVEVDETYVGSNGFRTGRLRSMGQLPCSHDKHLPSGPVR